MSDPSRSSQPPEDWDRSDADIDRSLAGSARVIFPSHGRGVSEDMGRDPATGVRGEGKRTLSELLKLHAEKGTDVHFTVEEAARLGEVLGQWINSSLSPYEGEDDFFARAQDDSSVSRRSPTVDSSSRPRGQSESVVSKS